MTTLCRRFNGRAVTRLIVSVPTDVVAEVDRLLAELPGHPARGCRSEFVRLALAEKLGRDLMFSRRDEVSGSLLQKSLDDRDLET